MCEVVSIESVLLYYKNKLDSFSIEADSNDARTVMKDTVKTSIASKRAKFSQLKTELAVLGVELQVKGNENIDILNSIVEQGKFTLQIGNMTYDRKKSIELVKEISGVLNKTLSNPIDKASILYNLSLIDSISPLLELKYSDKDKEFLLNNLPNTVIKNSEGSLLNLLNIKLRFKNSIEYTFYEVLKRQSVVVETLLLSKLEQRLNSEDSFSFPMLPYIYG